MAERVPDPSELAEDLRRIEAAVERGSRETREAIAALARDMASTYVRRDVYDAHHETLRREVAGVKESIKWAWRTAIAAFVLPLLVVVIAGLLIGSGVR